MGEAGVDRFHIAHVLNHRSVTHSTVTAIYDRYRYDKEKRAALEKWAEVLSGIVDVKPAPTTAPAKRTNNVRRSSRGPSDVPAIRHERGRLRTYAVCVAIHADIAPNVSSGGSRKAGKQSLTRAQLRVSAAEC